MNLLKRVTGLFWIIIAIAVLVFMMSRPGIEIEHAKTLGKPLLEIQMFWWVVLPIFTPILIGLGLFGWYAWKGEYDRIV